MIKDVLEANDGVRPFAKQIEGLKALFPGCFHKDGSLDFGELKRQLEGKVSIQNEGYGLNFLGKSYARLLASLDTTTVITPDKEHNDKEENRNSDNLYISGDNIDALKHLLKSYEGQIKCIYIDPPYNTGSDGFVYNDKFNFTATDLMEKLSIDEEEAVKILDLTKRKSASHSAWLLFMYPRLQLARDLLTEDGVIFISIDDNEQADLKLLCDDIFGEENCIGPLIQNKQNAQNDTSNIQKNHEFILVYGKNVQTNENTLLKLNLTKRKNIIFEDGRYYYISGAITTRSDGELTKRLNLGYTVYYNFKTKDMIPIMDYDMNLAKISNDEETVYTDNKELLNLGYVKIRPPKVRGNLGRWTWDIEKFKRDKDNVVVTGKEGSFTLKKRVFVNKSDVIEEQGKLIYNAVVETNSRSIIDFSTNDGTNALNELFLVKGLFSYPKNPEMLKYLYQMINESENAIYCDFFSGSATTAQAILELNQEKHSHRKFILVQIPEITKEESIARKNGYNTIDEIGFARIEKVAKKIKEEHPDTQTDLGFRHYTLQEPNQEAINEMFDFNPMSSNDLFVATDLYKQFGKDTILTTWLVRDGYHFAKESEVETLDLGGYTGYYMGHHLYLIDPGCDEAAVQAIFDRYAEDVTFRPTHVVVFGYNFTWTELENLQNNLRHFKDVEDNLRISVDVRY